MPRVLKTNWSGELRQITSHLRQWFSETPSKHFLDAQVLEERILYSGTPMPIDAALVDGIEGGLSQPEDTTALVAAELLSQENATPDSQPRDAVFIDSSLDDLETLLEQYTQDESADVFLIHRDADGISFITDALAQSDGYSAVHIVTHGTSGTVQLGDVDLTANNVADYQAQLASWKDYLNTGADLLIYGCDVAQTEDGRGLLTTLSAWTGADVAASIDLTGHQTLGGDWDLEYVTGRIETEVAFQESVLENWVGLLNAPTDLQATDSTALGFSLNEDGGNNRYLQSNAVGDALDESNTVTLEVSFSLSTLSSNRAALVSYALGSNDDELALYVNNSGQLQLSVDSSVTDVTSNNAYTQLLDGEQHHVAVSWDASTGAVVFYVDGVREESFSGIRTGGELDGGGTFVIGQDQDSPGGGFSTAEVFHGTLYYVRVFDDVRSDSEISNNYDYFNPAFYTSGLVAHWYFDNFSSAGVVTESVNGYDLTIGEIVGTGWIASEGVLELQVDENAANSTTVTTIVATDPQREALVTTLLASDPDLTYDAESGKFYLVVDNSTDWNSAKSAAESTLLNGVAGQLVTIRSASENALITSMASALGGSVWLGASDVTTEGQWFWIDEGADADQFWTGGTLGNKVNGSYTNWEFAAQPDNQGGNQDAASLSSSDGKWSDDTVTGTSHKYVVEWDADEILDVSQAIVFSIESQTVAGAFTIDANTGLLTVANGSLLNYESNADHVVTVRATDVDSNTYDEDFTIHLNNVNDAPVNTVPGAKTVWEATATAIGGVSITDEDAGSADVTTRLQVTAGVLNISLSGSATISAGANGSGDLTLQGSVADINATLVSLTYTGNNGVTGTAADSLTITTNDGGNTGSGSAQQDVDAVQIDIIAPNQAPTDLIAAFPAGSQDALDQTIVTIGSQTGSTDTSATLSNGNSVTVSISGSGVEAQLYDAMSSPIGSPLVVASGSVHNIDSVNQPVVAALPDGGFIVVMTATGYIDDGNYGTEVIGRIYDNQGNTYQLTPGTGSITDFNVSNDLFRISGPAIEDHDRPTVDVDVSGNITVSWRNVTDSTFEQRVFQSNLGVSEDAVAGTTVATLATTDPDSGDTHSYQIVGVSSNFEIVGAEIRVKAGADLDAATSHVLQIRTTDNGTGNLTYDENVTIAVQLVNDAPVNTVPGTQTVAEETTTGINGISISDEDAGSSDVTTRLQVTAGVVNVTLSGSTMISSGANGSGELTLQGTVADINATLASLTYTGNTDVVGTAADTLTVTTDDGGNSGSGGALQDVDVVQIDITAVNDAPVITAPGAALSATEQVGLAIHGAGFSATDVDEGGSGATATLTVGEGTLTIVEGDSGVAVSSGNGTSTVVITGTIAQINHLLTGGGSGTITYLNSSDAPSAFTTVTVTVNDGGNTGSDPGVSGDGSSEEGTNSQTINIAATNDDPTNVGSLPSDITVLEDVGSHVDLSAIDLSDADHGGSTLTVTLTTSTGGLLSANNGGGVTVGGSGTTILSLTGTQANLNTFLDGTSNVQYVHGVAHTHGNDADALSVAVNDNGNTGSGGGTNIAFGVVNVDITAVNDAPVLDNSGDMTLTTIHEDNTSNTGNTIAEILASASGDRITDTDVGDGDGEGVAITSSVSGSGTWEYSTNGGGSWIAVGTVSDTSALLLRDTDRIRFVPDAQNGDAVNFAFRAWDQSSGLAGTKVDASVGGNATAFSLALETASLTVTAVNDAPTLQDGYVSGLGAIHENATSSVTTVFNILWGVGGNHWDDVDSGASGGMAITSATSNGNWQYSTDGSTWTNFGSVGPGNALLLDENTQVRFEADGLNGETAAFEYIAWDGTTDTASTSGTPSYTNPGSTGGTTAYSTEMATVTIQVAPVNDIPVAVSDTDTAVEAGGLANSTGGSDPSGNVLANDVEVDAGDTLTVTGVDVGIQSSVTGNVGVAVTGSYGWLTIQSDGSYTYIVDNNDGAVQALRTAGDTLQDVFTYAVTDGNSVAQNTQITITIQGTNDHPHDLVPTGMVIAENSANSSLVGHVAVSDVDAIDGRTYSLLNDAGGRFVIGANTGDVRVADSSQLDYEVSTSHTITVRVTDTAGAAYDESLIVTLIDEDEYGVGPLTDLDSTLNQVDENATLGTTVGIEADAVDLDRSNNAITYSLLDDDDGRFAIDANTGVVTVADAIDREADGPSRSITVRATSSDGSTEDRTFSITINDLDEWDVAPVVDGDGATNEVAENAAIGTAVGLTAVASDGDATNNSITYSLLDDDGGRFAIDANSGEVTVAGAIDRETDGPLRTVTVRAISTDGSYTDQTFQIGILDSNEAPIAVEDQYTTTYVDDLVLAASGVAANDIDPDGDPLSVVLVTEPAMGSVTLSSDGSFVYQPVPGFIGQVTMEYYATDGGLQSGVQTVTIQITMPNELPPPIDPGGGGDDPFDDPAEDGDTDPEDETSEGDEMDEVDSDDLNDELAEEVISKDASGESPQGAQAITGSVGAGGGVGISASGRSEGTAERVGQASESRFDDEQGESEQVLANNVIGRLSNDQELADLRLATESKLIVQQLETLQLAFHDLEEQVQEELDHEFFASVDPIVATAVGTGVVVWVLHVGQVAAAVLTTASTWVHFDPLAILENKDLADEALTAEDQLFDAASRVHTD